MAKQIIILDKIPDKNVRVVFWLVVPLTRQPFFADANKTSQWSGITAQELQDIKDGKILEEVAEFGVDIEKSLAVVKALLQSEFSKRQTRITSLNHWKFYGSFYDGIDWTTGGIV